MTLQHKKQIKFSIKYVACLKIDIFFPSLFPIMIFWNNYIRENITIPINVRYQNILSNCVEVCLIVQFLYIGTKKRMPQLSTEFMPHNLVTVVTWKTPRETENTQSNYNSNNCSTNLVIQLLVISS